VSDGLPVVSGQRLVKALQRAGWVTVRQRGSHVRLKCPPQASRRNISLTVPLHRELKRGTLAGILTDAGLDAELL
jgi:predicted RNA binding protein YcfA (HicA-like mRNA interferase family)